VLILAFDTATDVATSALVDSGAIRGERVSRASTLLEDLDVLLHDAGVTPADVDALVVGTGPGSFTGTRIGLAVARGLALALDLPAAGVSTLDALAAAAAGVLPVVDARRGEVFVPGPRAVAPDGLGASVCGVTCVGDGARRYRIVLERAGAVVPPDASPLHVPRASLHAALAVAFGPAEAILPVYGRVPDAVRSLA
jgi:tRNA threonylcarbamoyladenosine biosynthesis protein TsaB